MLIREIVGTTVAGLTAAALALAPGVFQAPAPGPSATPTGPVRTAPSPEAAPVVLHSCPSTSESECRAVFLPPLGEADSDGAAHTTHAPEIRICGPMSEGMSLESATSCDDAGTGPVVATFPFSCGDTFSCVEVVDDHYRADWLVCENDEGDDEDDDDGDDEGDDDDGDDEDANDCEEDDDDDDGDEDDDDDDGDDDDEVDTSRDAVDDGFYLIEARLNGGSAGSVVIELVDDDDSEDDDDDDGDGGGDDDDDSDDDDDGDTCTGGTGLVPAYCVGDTVPIKFRLHDKIVG